MPQSPSNTSTNQLLRLKLIPNFRVDYFRFILGLELQYYTTRQCQYQFGDASARVDFVLPLTPPTSSQALYGSAEVLLTGNLSHSLRCLKSPVYLS